MYSNFDKEYKTKDFSSANTKINKIYEDIKNENQNELLDSLINESKIIRDTKEYYKKVNFTKKINI